MKFLDPKEAIRTGVVQEANRLFFHQLGLALSVRIDEITGIASYVLWDARDDAEGIWFSDEIVASPDARAKASAVARLRSSKHDARRDLLGSGTQRLVGFDDTAPK